LFLGLALLIFGRCGYRYRKLQDILFSLSYRLWVNDPEPSDFYYFMCNAGGLIVMIASVFVALQAF